MGSITNRDRIPDEEDPWIPESSRIATYMSRFSDRRWPPTRRSIGASIRKPSRWAVSRERFRVEYVEIETRPENSYGTSAPLCRPLSAERHLRSPAWSGHRPQCSQGPTHVRLHLLPQMATWEMRSWDPPAAASVNDKSVASKTLRCKLGLFIASDRLLDNEISWDYSTMSPISNSSVPCTVLRPTPITLPSKYIVFPMTIGVLCLRTPFE